MMKKKLIAGALALSMILAGTGYAYWTDALNITTEASTGNLEMKFMDLGLYAQYDNESRGWSIIDGIGKGYESSDAFARGMSNYNIIAKEGTENKYYKSASQYNDVSFDAELVNPTRLNVGIGDYKCMQVDFSDGIEVSLDNIYPGYAQAFRTDVGNIGNVAAKLSDIDITVSGEDKGNLEDMIGVAFYASRELNKDGEGKVVGFAENFSEDDIFTMGGVNFVRLSALKNFEFADVDFTKNTLLTVPSENRMDFTFAVGMDPDADGNYTTGSTSVMNTDNDDAQSMNKSISFKMNFLWDQFNEGMETQSIRANILDQQN